MTNQRPRMKRADATGSSGVNAVINAANASDRFKLLEDDTVLPANLKNAIHPLFHQLEDTDHLQLALQLASHFLLHDRLVNFFVPLLYGKQMRDSQSAKNFLCDPLVYACKERQAQYQAGVRQALRCLAKHLSISFVDPRQKRIYACTLAKDVAPSLTSSCCRAFQDKRSPTIEMSDRFLQFYKDPQGYARASRCAQFRHDFIFATTLVHEVVHAVGVMRRGNTVEPHYQLDYPDTEWGYAWENFMFGSIFNPQERSKSGTHLLMRKVWANADVAEAAGGKEYFDVSVSWVAQWFRTETWDIVAERGPTAIAPPTTHFKIQNNRKLDAWVVYSEDLEVRRDLLELNALWRESEKDLDIIHWQRCTAAGLQESSVPVPLRVRQVPQPCMIQKMVMPSRSKVGTKQPPLAYKMPPPTTVPLVSAYRMSSAVAIQRKRKAAVDSDCDDNIHHNKRSRS